MKDHLHGRRYPVPQTSPVYYPVILLESSLYPRPSTQDKYFSGRFLHLPLKYAASRSFYSPPATPRGVEFPVDAAIKFESSIGVTGDVSC